jgi:hypothetical protein
MSPFLRSRGLCAFLLGAGLAGFLAFPVAAEEKEGMPDLSQVEQTCLPTSTTNLILWFGKHGYPKLILSGATDDERALHSVHVMMADTDARFDWGTRMENVTTGIKKYIVDAGYDCDVEYRGLQGKTAFSQDWLKENDDPNKGFILLLAYCSYDPATDTFTDAWHAGHAVTLVNVEPNLLLIHDPAHRDDQAGRKIITPRSLTSGSLAAKGMIVPVSGLMLLSGSLLRSPPHSEVMLTGAICITMHPARKGAPPSPIPAAAPNATIAGSGSATPGSSSSRSAPAVPGSTETSWTMWLFDLLFKK